MCHIFFIHSSVDGHFGCFHVLAIVNRAVKRVMYHIFLFKLVFSFSLYKCPEVELLDNIVVLFLIFWENSILYSIAVETIYILTNSAWGFPFSTSSSTLFISCVLDNKFTGRMVWKKKIMWFSKGRLLRLLRQDRKSVV